MTEDLGTGQTAAQQGVTAVVKWFNPFKGFGFVRLGEDPTEALSYTTASLELADSEEARSCSWGTWAFCQDTRWRRARHL